MEIHNEATMGEQWPFSTQAGQKAASYTGSPQHSNIQDREGLILFHDVFSHKSKEIHDEAHMGEH